MLIDTNILIHLEDNHVIDTSFAKFYNLALLNKCEIYYHPSCLIDIRKDKDENRKKITISKLNKYIKMPNCVEPTQEFILEVGQKNDNDKIDNTQLFQIYKGYVDYFITEDKGIKEKATKLGIGKNVISMEDGYKILREKYTITLPLHPLLTECSVRDIENEINDDFFNSLRDSYTDFNNWFKKCAQLNRHCYLLRNQGKIAALLIYNREQTNDHKLEGIHSDAYKMCTFKVGETTFGYKLGELFLNKMFTLCINSQVTHLYLTVLPHHRQLIDLLTRYGFQKNEFENDKGDIELRMIKSLKKSDYIQNPQEIKSHPFYTDGPSRNKFVIPIRPEFYNTLFKDGNLRVGTLFDEAQASLNEIEGNTISKAYICKSKSLLMKTGDLLFFYNSSKNKCIEPVGILDSVTYTNDIGEIKSLVHRRTVYSDKALEEFANSKKNVTVLVFRLLYYLQTPITNKVIRTLESYTNKFQAITVLKETDYINLKEKGCFNERFIIN